MSNLTQEDLKKILRAHEVWLRRGKGPEKAGLRGADLRGANLMSADLRDADLEGTNLRDADLLGVIGNMRQIKSMQTDCYTVTYTADTIQIGCQRHPIADWWEFDDRRILEMDGRKAIEWWRRWKPVLQRIIETSPAETTADAAGGPDHEIHR